MKKLQPVSEAEVISEFLRNEFYQEDFHSDRDKFEKLVMNADLNDELENSVRRALLFRRRGHLWRELPADTQWWLVQMEAGDLAKIRVFPRARWRRISRGSLLLSDVVQRIRTTQFSGSVAEFIARIQALSYRLRKESDSSCVLLIGVDEHKPMTILEGNHRMAAAMLASPELLQWQFRVVCGFSPRMQESCWYQTSFSTLWRYFKNRVRHINNKDADVARAFERPLVSARSTTVIESKPAAGERVSEPNALLDSK